MVIYLRHKIYGWTNRSLPIRVNYNDVGEIPINKYLKIMCIIIIKDNSEQATKK